MNERIRRQAGELGFARAFFLTPAPLPRWREAVCEEGQFPEARRLSEPGEACPEARCLVLLVYPYLPFAPGERIPAYYLASQRGYLAVRELIAWLEGQGYRASLPHLPASALALRHGIGHWCRNGLLSLPEYGTRMVLYVLATDAALPELAPLPGLRERDPACEGCKLCARACPAGAIDPMGGLTPIKCMRAHMERAPFPSWVEESMPGFLGCELCQSVCPRNRALPLGEPTPEQREAFSLPRLARGDAAEARRMVGRNITRQEKLSYQARIFLQRDMEPS